MDAIQQAMVVPDVLPEELQPVYERYVNDFKENLSRNIQRWKNTLEILKKLQSLSLYTGKFEYCDIVYTTSVKVEPEHLPALRTQFEIVKDTGNYDLHDEEAQTVKVYLNLGYEPNNVSCYMVKPLSAYAKCSLVKETRVESRLVCNG